MLQAAFKIPVSDFIHTRTPLLNQDGIWQVFLVGSQLQQGLAPDQYTLLQSLSQAIPLADPVLVFHLHSVKVLTAPISFDTDSSTLNVACHILTITGLIERSDSTMELAYDC